MNYAVRSGQVAGTGQVTSVSCLSVVLCEVYISMIMNESFIVMFRVSAEGHSNTAGRLTLKLSLDTMRLNERN